ncbi:MAG: HAMP domain-containing histidine kinase [Firmicutes bacterium]|nr:HAMP domain-containing histidine kinase [Bacillota bacterium]
MSKITQQLWLKVLMIIFFVVMCCVVLVTGIAIVIAIDLKLFWVAEEWVVEANNYWLSLLYYWREYVVAVLAGSALLAILSLTFLLTAAGHRPGSDKPQCNMFDRIPLEIVLGLEGAGFIVMLALLVEIIRYDLDNIIMCIIAGVLFVGITLLVLSLLMTLTTRLKTRTIWRNTLIYRILRFCYRLMLCIPVVWKGTALIIAILIYNFIVFMCMINYAEGWAVIMIVCECVVLVPAAIFMMYEMTRLQKAGEEIAAGNLQYHIATEHIHPASLRRHGENLNNISKGLSLAVEQKMKSERFKTELITNVSHDIKTPLTSIVNYVDLLKKENLENEKAKEYLDVLDRQSARLKKLTEDLVEASKASTGNLPVDMEPIEVGTMLEQAVGEYDERLKQNQLETVLLRGEEEVYIMADGRLLWRVLDNLVSNVCKYGMPGTRFYVTLVAREKDVYIVLRNISKYQLNVSSEELLNRFVRGDSSRHTEGSGLGLSIAQSLTQLQKGSVELKVDGDLFKVVLKFPRLVV